jgi:hypothetical protein
MERKMKKLALVLGLVMVALMFAACGIENQEENGNDTPLLSISLSPDSPTSPTDLSATVTLIKFDITNESNTGIEISDIILGYESDGLVITEFWLEFYPELGGTPPAWSENTTPPAPQGEQMGFNGHGDEWLSPGGKLRLGVASLITDADTDAFIRVTVTSIKGRISYDQECEVKGLPIMGNMLTF